MSEDNFNYDELDPGIRKAVRVLREAEYETTDSGDGSKAGETEGALDYPHVFIRLPATLDLVAEAHRAQRYLNEAGLPGSVVKATYSTKDETAMLLVRWPSVRLMTYSTKSVAESLQKAMSEDVLDIVRETLRGEGMFVHRDKPELWRSDAVKFLVDFTEDPERAERIVAGEEAKLSKAAAVEHLQDKYVKAEAGEGS